MSNEELIGMAEEIVLVRMKPPKNRIGLFGFFVMEALRGESHPVGSTFRLPNQYGGDSHLMNLGPAPDGMVAFFKKDWKSEEFPVIRMVTNPDRVAVIRKLVAPLSLPTELERIEATYALYKANPSNEQIFRTFLSEFGKMRNRENSSRALDIFEHADPKIQYSLMGSLKIIAGERAVPMLIEFLDDGDIQLSYGTGHFGANAANELASVFPGAPGVTQAMRDHLSNPKIEYEAARYLNRREPTPELRAIIERGKVIYSTESKWIRGRHEALERGESEAIRRLCIPLIEDESVEENTYGIKPMYRCTAFLDVLPYLSDPEKLNMQNLLIPVIEPWLFSWPGSQLILGAKAKFLSMSNQPNAEELLIQLFVRNENYTRYDQVVATMALRDGSPELRAVAIASTLQAIDQYVDDAIARRSRDVTEAGRLLMNLAWLGDEWGLEEGFNRMEAIEWSGQTQSFQMIELFELGPNEDSRLLRRLQQIIESDSFNEWSHKRQSIHRLIYRLGHLRSEKAIPILFNEMGNPHADIYYVDEALLTIGSSLVVDTLYSHFRAAKDQRHKYRLAELLWKLTGSEMLPFIRELAVNDGTQLQKWAWQKLGDIGTPEDLELLRPYTDYWQPNAAINGTTGWPLAQIRDGHNYDLNGPIVPRR